jgi:hypothetical protein
MALPRPHSLQASGLNSLVHWYSPFPLAGLLESRLQEAGLTPWPGGQPPAAAGQPLAPAAVGQPGGLVIALYDAPDQVLDAWRHCLITPPGHDGLLEGYAQLLALAGSVPLLSGWRLAAIEPGALRLWLESRQWHSDGAGALQLQAAGVEPPSIRPLTAAALRALVSSHPALLDRYLELEALAERAGTAPDQGYLQRLLARCNDGDALVSSWWDATSVPQASALQHQIEDLQVELERTFLASQQAEQHRGRLEEALQEQGQALQAAQQQRDQAQQALATAATVQQQLGEERAALAQELAGLRAQADTSGLTQRLLTLELAQAREEQHFHRDQAHQAQQQLEACQRQLETAQQQQDTCRQQHETCRQQLQASQQEMQSRVEQLNQLGGQLAEERARGEQLSAELELLSIRAERSELLLRQAMVVVGLLRRQARISRGSALFAGSRVIGLLE